jgi:hypothetical protein
MVMTILRLGAHFHWIVSLGIQAGAQAAQGTFDVLHGTRPYHRMEDKD